MGMSWRFSNLTKFLVILCFPSIVGSIDMVVANDSDAEHFSQQLHEVINSLAREEIRKNRLPVNTLDCKYSNAVSIKIDKNQSIQSIEVILREETHHKKIDEAIVSIAKRALEFLDSETLYFVGEDFLVSIPFVISASRQDDLSQIDCNSDEYSVMLAERERLNNARLKELRKAEGNDTLPREFQGQLEAIFYEAFWSEIAHFGVARNFSQYFPGCAFEHEASITIDSNGSISAVWLERETRWPLLDRVLIESLEKMSRQSKKYFDSESLGGSRVNIKVPYSPPLFTRGVCHSEDIFLKEPREETAVRRSLIGTKEILLKCELQGENDRPSLGRFERLDGLLATVQLSRTVRWYTTEMKVGIKILGDERFSQFKDKEVVEGAEVPPIDQVVFKSGSTYRHMSVYHDFRDFATEEQLINIFKHDGEHGIAIVTTYNDFFEKDSRLRLSGRCIRTNGQPTQKNEVVGDLNADKERIASNETSIPEYHRKSSYVWSWFKDSL